MSDIVKHEMNQLPVANMNEMAQVGQMLAQSGMFGDGSNPGVGLVVAMTCYQEGITPIDFVRNYHIIGNKPAKRSDAIASDFRSRGGKYKVLENTKVRAAAEFTFEGNTTLFEYTLEDAKEAQLTGKAVWKKHPANMLWARMISNAVRVLCPECIHGVYTPEEMEAVLEDEKPQAIDPVEAAKRVNAQAQQVDYELCPIEYEGAQPNSIAWTQFPTDALQSVANGSVSDPRITEGHIQAVNRTLEVRAQQ
jgi:hypothetical protein